MNPDTKTFHPEVQHGPDLPPSWPRLKIGDVINVRGWGYRVRKITKKDVILRPVGMLTHSPDESK